MWNGEEYLKMENPFQSSPECMWSGAVYCWISLVSLKPHWRKHAEEMAGEKSQKEK